MYEIKEYVLELQMYTIPELEIKFTPCRSITVLR